MIDMELMGRKSKAAASQMATATTDQKNRALQLIADNIIKYQKQILDENNKDIEAAKKHGMVASLLDRLGLNNCLEGIARDVESVIKLPDPIEEAFDQHILSNALNIEKKRIPIGVIGVIYEARPNVTIDISVLCIKTGNCVILRGGSESLRSNKSLVAIIQDALRESGLPIEAVQLIENSDRQLVKSLLHLHKYVDMIIPRGGAELHLFCRENSTIPVITGGIGICHLFVDDSANIIKSLEVIYNAKTQRPTVCNALDTLLVHRKIAETFIPLVTGKLGKAGVEFRIDLESRQWVNPEASCQLADSHTWDTEWLSLILGIKIVDGLEEAMSHIKQHSTEHSDGILTENPANAERFVREINSAAVYVNASTRFTDGGQFGLGAEVAVSTQKLHARGPMGLKELTTYKWIIHGDYQVRK